MCGDKGTQLFARMSTVSMGKGKKIVWYSLLKRQLGFLTEEKASEN